MNRNAESHFAQLPHAEIQRSRFDRAHSMKFTGNVGDVIPFMCEPVLPGDTWDITTSKIMRLQTMVSPVMDSLFLDVYYFFVPLRLTWEHAKEFFGENTQTSWYPQTTYSIPKIEIGLNGVDTGSIMDYLGIPPIYPSTVLPSYKAYVNALRLRGYLLICNEWFRDQNLENPLNIYTGDGTVTYDPNVTEYGGTPFKAAKMHDYFTSCLPGPQKAGSPVDIPVVGALPVVTRDPQTMPGQGTNFMPLEWQSLNGVNKYYSKSPAVVQDTSQTNVSVAKLETSSTGTQAALIAPSNLYATSAYGVGNTFLSMTVNDLRLAFQTQKFLEKQARGGSRYREILLSHFGVTSPDARQQVPEYLGGNRIPLNIHQVINQAETANQPLGNLGAFSQTSDVHDDVFKSFTEHGYIYGCAVVRYCHTYSQAADRDWFVDTMYDFYWPVFSSISEQPVYTRELYFDSVHRNQIQPVFGYQEAWASYRYAINRVAGEMRPYVNNGLFSWSFADVYSNQPTLSASWIKEDKNNVDRALAVSSSVSNQFWADFYIKANVTRPMPLYSIPGLVDHF